METRRAESPVQTGRNEGDCGLMTVPVFGYERLARTTSGAMISCMNGPMMGEPFGY